MYWDFHGAQPNPSQHTYVKCMVKQSRLPLPFDSTTIVKWQTIYLVLPAHNLPYNTSRHFTRHDHNAYLPTVMVAEMLGHRFRPGCFKILLWLVFSYTSNGCGVNQAVQFTDLHTVKTICIAGTGTLEDQPAKYFRTSQDPFTCFSTEHYGKFSNIQTPGCLVIRLQNHHIETNIL